MAVAAVWGIPVASAKVRSLRYVPIEKNARRLIGVLLQYFPADGGTSEDLRRAFAKETGLVAPQSFYAALKHCKKEKWLTGGGRDQFYSLAADGSWREPVPPVRESFRDRGLEKPQLEDLADAQKQQIGELEDELAYLRDWSGSDANGVAIPSLIKIITDRATTMRQKLRAASTVLSYRVDDSSVVEFTRRFLQATCMGADVAADHRCEAAELLRRCESPKIAPSTVRPDYQDETPTEPIEPLRDVVARRRAHCDRLTAQIEREMGWQGPTTVSNDSADD